MAVGRGHVAAVVAVGLMTAVPSAVGAQEPPWRLVSPDGRSSVQFGLLAQPQGEWLTTPDGQATAANLFLRRLRLIAGGRILDKITFFIDTDSPNLGKGNADGTKTAGDMFLQDVIVTYNIRNELRVDAGLLLVPLAHNGTQGATTLLPVDYGAYSFTSSEPTTSRVGRDYGVQARGYLFGDHLEYRAGVFEGYRGVNATAPFRYTTRLVWYPYEAETGFFYTGTNLGTRRILAVGASLDHQDDYDAAAVDVYLDWPVGDGNGVTLQGDLVRYDGGTTFTTLPRQDSWLIEAGFFHKVTRLGPFAQLAGRDGREAGVTDERRYLGGVAYWASGHRFNLKLGVGRATGPDRPSRTQVVIQGQVYIY